MRSVVSQGDGADDAPSLPFLREVIHPHLHSVRATRFKVSASPSALYRLTLEYAPNAEGLQGEMPSSLILKRIAPDWEEDEYGWVREVRFYSTLYPHLQLDYGRVYFAGAEPDTNYQIVILEDRSATHRFPPPTHLWHEEEIVPIVRAYAAFHRRGQPYVKQARQEGWLFLRHEERISATAERLPFMVESIVKQGIWFPLPTFPALLERTLKAMERLADAPVTLIHGDVYPPNVGLPLAGSEGQVMLLDWEMVSWGLAEMDLAYMFCQPYRSHRALNKTEVLAAYWAERERLGATRESHATRAYRQRYADSVIVLWLLPVAYRMAQQPFPPDSPVRHFWDSNFQLLGERLQALCDER